MRRHILISTVCKCISKFTWCPKLPDLTLLHTCIDKYTCMSRCCRVKSGKFGQSAIFGQQHCFFLISFIGIKNKLTKQTVKIRLISIFTVCNCLSEFTNCPKLPDFTLLQSSDVKTLALHNDIHLSKYALVLLSYLTLDCSTLYIMLLLITVK